MNIAICSADKQFIDKLISFFRTRFPFIGKLFNITVFSTEEKILIQAFKKSFFYDMIIFGIDSPKQKADYIINQLQEIDIHFYHFHLFSTQKDVLEYLPADALTIVVKKEFTHSVYPSVIENKKIDKQSIFFVIKGKKVKRLLKKINLEEIAYFETLQRKVLLHTQHEIFELIDYKISELQKKLQIYGFLNVHRTCLVNILYIDKIINNTLILEDGTELPISRRKKSAVIKEIVHQGYMEHRNKSDRKANECNIIL